VTAGRARQDADGGNITLLSLGFLVLTVALILVVSAATAVHVDRLRAVRLADDVAIDVADTLDVPAFYRGELPEPTADAGIVIDPNALTEVARDAVRKEAPRYDLDQVVVVSAYSPDGRSVVVTLAVRSPVLFGADSLLPWSDGVVITVSSSARAY
jgi:hypothetical protein